MAKKMRSSKLSRRRARVLSADKNRLQRIGVNAGGAYLVEAARVVMAAYTSGGSPAQAFGELLDGAFTDLLLDAAVVAHFWGRYRTYRNAELWRGKVMDFAQGRIGTPGYDQAVRFIVNQMRGGWAQVPIIRDLYAPQIEESVSLFAKQARMKINQTMTTVVTEGLHTQGGIAMLRESLASVGFHPSNPYMLENIFRNHVNVAYSAGRWNALQSDALQEILWGFEIVTVGDSRVRPKHIGLDGVTLPKEDRRWEELWPPNGYSCRCSTIEIFDSGDTRVPPNEIVVDGDPVVPGPDKGWDFNPGTMNPDAMQKLPGRFATRPRAKPKPPKPKPKRKPVKVKGPPLEANGKPMTEADHRAIGTYTSYGYEDVVRHQLAGKFPVPRGTGTGLAPTAEMRRHVKGIEDAAIALRKATERALKKLPGVPGTSYRGLKFGTSIERRDFLATFKPGEAYQFKAFQSSSSSKVVANTFMGKDPKRYVRLHIEGKSGRNVKPYSRNKAEDEILFMKGSTFRVDRVVGMIVHLVEM